MSQRKKIKDMTRAELAEYNREVKRRSRERREQERLAKLPLNASDYRMPNDVETRLTAHTDKVRQEILAQLLLSSKDVFIIETVSDVVFGLENDISRKVCEPTGMLVAGHFPDAVWRMAIEHVNRFPGLLTCPEFEALYNKFLDLVAKWNETTGAIHSDPEFVGILAAEIAGTYTPSWPTLAVPIQTEPIQPPAPPTPIVSLPPEALRYLDGF
jgi:hypothetical protein